jgi:hypothetical protein
VARDEAHAIGMTIASAVADGEAPDAYFKAGRAERPAARAALDAVERRAHEQEAAGTELLRHASFGEKAVKAGTPDYGKNGDDAEGSLTDASDTIANILHHLREKGIDLGDIDLALERGRRRFVEEWEEAEEVA